MILDGLSLEDHPVLSAAEYERLQRDRRRSEPPLVRIWDGDWNLRGIITGEKAGQAWRRSNETGEIAITITPDNYLWDWVTARRQAKQRANTFITVDKDGVRISGTVTNFAFEKDGERSVSVTLEALDDMEHLKNIRIWSNPVLHAGIQFPRVFMLGGPSRWTIKTTWHLNIMRLQNALFTLPNDPLNFASYGASFDMRNWQVVVKPGSWFGDDSPHAIVTSRFKSAYDMASTVVEDSGLEIVYRRYLPGDADPWPGYQPRTGQLVFDIVDKQRRWDTGQGMITGGNVLGGAIRTIKQLASDFVEDSRTVVPDTYTPDTETAGTSPGSAWVVYRESEHGGVESSKYNWAPPSHGNLVVGGHSAAGVNESISSAVQLALDLASSAFLGINVNLGQVADTWLRPLYTDTIAAWMAIKLHERVQRLGWSHFMEYMPSDRDRAYMLSSVLALRRAYVATDEKNNHSFRVADGGPYLVGDNGEGHFFVGDLIASSIPGTIDGELLVDKVSEAGFVWDRATHEWRLTVGSLYDERSGWDRILGRVTNLTTALHDQGVL